MFKLIQMKKLVNFMCKITLLKNFIKKKLYLKFI